MKDLQDEINYQVNNSNKYQMKWNKIVEYYLIKMIGKLKNYHFH